MSGAGGVLRTPPDEALSLDRFGRDCARAARGGGGATVCRVVSVALIAMNWAMAGWRIMSGRRPEALRYSRGLRVD